jgi:transcriptional regulator with XRE-family HTH domain
MASKLPNYLRSYRKQWGLTQTDVAYLLGSKSPGKVSEYESFDRLPNLKTALLYEAIFGAPVSRLFAGVYQQVEKDAARRARLLQQKKSTQANLKSSRKRELLRMIAITPDINKENP